MNVFVLDKDPEKAAKMYCDKHVVKIILELCQMMSTTHHLLDSPFNGYLYKPTHINHPCTKWLREYYQNYNWAFIHLKALLKEYNIRYNKEHKCEQLIKWLEFNPVCERNVDYYWTMHTPFAQAMPEKYKNIDPIKAYRDYYNGEKAGFAKWKIGNEPEWFIRTSK